MAAQAANSTAPEPTPADEKRLLAALRHGDDSAFETLVRRYSAPLLSVVRRIVRNDDDAREALQDAFISIFKAVGGFTGDSRLGTWLHRIAVNAALMKLRTRRRHPETSIEELLPKFQADGHELVSNEAWQESASELLERQETRELVRQTIDSLPETYRVVLLLRDIEELSTDEVARMLEATPNAVKIRLHRARQALRTRLDQRFRTPVVP